jgi:hypothetical protein
MMKLNQRRRKKVLKLRKRLRRNFKKKMMISISMIGKVSKDKGKKLEVTQKMRKMKKMRMTTTMIKMEVS